MNTDEQTLNENEGMDGKSRSTAGLERMRFDAWEARNKNLVGQLDYYWSSSDAKFVVWEAALADLTVRNRK